MKFKIDDLQVGAIYLINYLDTEDNERSYNGPAILTLADDSEYLDFLILDDEKNYFLFNDPCFFGLENIVGKIDLNKLR